MPKPTPQLDMGGAALAVHWSEQASYRRPGFLLPRQSEAPCSARAFDLVTWLIIKPTEQQAG